MAILYSVIGTFIFGLILKWIGFFRWIYRKFKYKRGMLSYRKQLKKECSSLIVVGSRHGFTMKDVFVPLDIVTTDLTTILKDSLYYPTTSYILVGGPGAGKSTYVKKLILDELVNKNIMPFFIRLRDLSSLDIKDYLIQKLKKCSIPESEKILETKLEGDGCLCVLDGLDEIRPNIKERVFENINKFYSQYFKNNKNNRLIVTCRKEAYRSLPLDIPDIWEVRPLTDEQIKRFAQKWPLGYPEQKSADTFWRDLSSIPRILELARSPLLLVGGLMQYTESNLGIPEERYEYLERLAKWLVSDWAVARNLPPDPFRSVYDRILIKLAFNIHNSYRTDYFSNEAIKLIRLWLPDYGFQSKDAEKILENIMIKTGILVRDTPTTVVFSHFGFQEYYASKYLVDNISINKLVSFSPKTWWRESIILAIAQRKEPSPILEALFLKNPLLAAAAVAECPTPSIAMQEKAINICLSGIDNKNAAFITSTILLMRKLKYEQESQLCSELESRIIQGSKVSSIVGLILSAAGTSAATDTLSKYPEVWDTCLENTGYLSTSFENLLVNWIKNGNINQSKRAAKLITSRLSFDRFNELMDLLPKLSQKKSEYLATLLLKEIEKGFLTHRQFSYADLSLYPLDEICRLAPYITDNKKFLKIFYFKNRWFSVASKLVGTSLLLKIGNRRANYKELLKYLESSASWQRNKQSLFSFLSSAVVIFCIWANPIMGFLALLTSLLIFAFGTLRERSSSLWEINDKVYYNFKRIAIFLNVVFAFFVLPWLLIYILKLKLYPLIYISIVALSIFYSIRGFILLLDYYCTDLNFKIKSIIRLEIPIIWIFFLIVLFFLIIFQKVHNSAILWIYLGALFFILWIISILLKLYYYWKKVINIMKILKKNSIISL